ncbi:hypothetical protein B4144_3809 [Bacillus atrophaeus]|nr:hypothetical protein B4144_3809 [Bacillus atrophaeus]
MSFSDHDGTCILRDLKNEKTFVYARNNGHIKQIYSALEKRLPFITRQSFFIFL